MVFNDVISYKNIDLNEESYLLHYFTMFENDKKNNLKYDVSLENRFVRRIEEIKSNKRKSENKSRQNLLNLLNEEIDKYKEMGLELSEEEMLKILLAKIRKD